MKQVAQLKNTFLSTIKQIIKQTINNKGKLLICLSGLIIASSSHAGWEVNFIDKFDGTSVNRDNWTAQTDANFNNEVQCYTDDDSSVNKNFDVSAGTLKIIARKQQVNCAGLNNQTRNWTSGRINGKDKREFLYGRIEARIRFHNLEDGTWPAFWMLENRIAESPRKNDNDVINWPNPGAGEIDVWEWSAKAPSAYITNFFNTGGSACGQELRFSYPNGTTDVLNWQDYAIEWDENNISFYMNDTLVSSNNISACAQYKEPMFVLLNVAMGGSLGGTIDPNLNKATMEVDYLAHCTATNQNDSKRCNEQTPTVHADGDNDGVSDDLDQCPNTVAGAMVDSDGCLVIEDNIAPSVTLSLKQNNVLVTNINIGDGLVEINANGVDENTNDELSFVWNVTGDIPSPSISQGKLTFDPSSMVAGTTHNIEVTVIDNATPALSAKTSMQFSVEDSVVMVVPPINSPKSSGGAFNYLTLLMLLLFRCRSA